MCLRYNYKVDEIYGVKWGYNGFSNPKDWILLTSNMVKDIHTKGGSIIGAA